MNNKVRKAIEEAQKLKAKVQQSVDAGKEKAAALKKEKEKLEAIQKQAKEKLDEAKKLKGKVTKAATTVKAIPGKVSQARKQINIGERLKAAFGALPKEAKTDGTEKKETKQFVNKITASTAIAFTNNATFEDLTLKRIAATASSNKESKEEQAKNEISFGDMAHGQNMFAPPPMVSFSKSKNLVITEIDGSDAEVVERYGDKSWEIKLQGIIIDMKNHQYPQAGVVKLREFFNAPEAFEVTTSTMFHNLDINSIYFTNVDISGVSGFADTIQYTLSARSIKPIEFTFTQHNK